MKKLGSTLLLGLLMTGMSYAADPSAVSLISIDPLADGKVQLNLKSLEKGRVQVKILNKKGVKLLEQTVNYDKSFNLPFDLSGLPQGSYDFVISGEEIYLKQEVFVSKMHEEDVAAIVTDLGKGRYKVKVYHETNTPVTISVQDRFGRSYYEETFRKEANFAINFDVTQIADKSPELMIKGRKSLIQKVL